MFKSPPIEKIHPFFSLPRLVASTVQWVHRKQHDEPPAGTKWLCDHGHNVTRNVHRRSLSSCLKETQSCVHPLDAPRVPSNPFVELETNQGPHHRWETLGCEFPSNDGKSAPCWLDGFAVKVQQHQAENRVRDSMNHRIGQSRWHKKLWTQREHFRGWIVRVSMLNRLMKERGDLLPLSIRLKRKTETKLSTRTERSVADDDVSHESKMWTRPTWTSEFQDYHIPLWSTRKTPAFDSDSENREPPESTRYSTRSTTESIIQSCQSRVKTNDSVNSSRRNPKRSAQCVYHTGTLAYSTARAGISCVKEQENKKFVQYMMDLLTTV